MSGVAIRAVLFDIGGVLVNAPPMDFHVDWAARLDLAEGAVWDGLIDVWRAGGVGTMTELEVHAAIRDRLGVSEARVEAMMADMWRQYLGTANEEMIARARGLRPRYRTGILSNSFVGAREREVRRYAFPDLVDDIVYSHEVGLRKPDPRIFELCCERLAVEPAELVLLDDVEENVAAAAELGIHAVHVRDNERAFAELDAILAR